MGGVDLATLSPRELARYRQQTGIASLKIRHNAVLGYHIDATPKQAETLVKPPHAARLVLDEQRRPLARIGLLAAPGLRFRIVEGELPDRGTGRAGRPPGPRPTTSTTSGSCSGWSNSN